MKTVKASKKTGNSQGSTESHPTENGAGARVAPVGELRTVAHAFCRPSPTQPRITFARMDELAASVRESGIRERLLVRAHPAECSLHEPDLTMESWTILDKTGRQVEIFTDEEAARTWADHNGNVLEAWFELVDGERRWRAAGLAGLAEVPVEMREMSDAEVIEYQLISFAQKEGLNEVDEGRAFRKLIDSGQHTVASLELQTGKSRSHIFGRMALAKLDGPVLEAFEAGKIEASMAAVVASVPDLAKQAELLKLITDENHYLYPFSVRKVKDTVERQYRTSLKGAPFDLKDGELDLDAGSCAKCPLRTGNMKELLGDDVDPNVCTSPTCYEGKVKSAAFAAEAKARAEGKTVLSEDEYRKASRDLVRMNMDYYIPGADEHPSYQELLGKHAAKAKSLAYVVMEGELQAVISREEAEKIVQEFKLVPEREPSKHQLEMEARDKLKVETDLVVKEAMGQIVANATGLGMEPASDFLRKVLLLLLRSDLDMNHLFDDRPQIMSGEREEMDEADALVHYATNGMEQSEQNVRGLILGALVEAQADWQGNPYPTFVQACELFGVDLEEIRSGLNKPKAKSKPKAKPKAKAAKAKKGKGKKK